MEPVSRRLLLMVTIGKGVPVQADLLGTRWELPAGLGMLVLPDTPVGPEPWRRDLLAPPIEGADRALTWFGKRDEDRHESVWGRGSGGFADRTLSEAFLRSAVVVTASQPFDIRVYGVAMMDEIAGALDDWIDAFCEWLEVVATIDMRPDLDMSAMTPKHVYPRPLAVDDDGNVERYPTMSQIASVWRSPRHVSLIEWSRAVEYTNAKRRPPEEHLLLRDSRAARNRHDSRKAVIDAATAAEVALAAAIRRRLSAAPDEQAIEQVLRNSSGLAELFDLAVALGSNGGVSGSQVRGQLAGRRNEAVHRGMEPTRAETTEALQTASAIVSAVNPLEAASRPE